MSRFVLIMLLLAATASPLKAFAVVSQIPSKTQAVHVTLGGSFGLLCTTSKYYGWCTFGVNGRKCDYVWNGSSFNITTADCADYANRTEFMGEYKSYECGIIVREAAAEDNGTWTCDLAKYTESGVRHQAAKAKGSFQVVVELPASKTNNTTNTTTSVTSDDYKGHDTCIKKLEIICPIMKNRSAVRDHTDDNKTELHKVAQYDYEYVGVYLTCGADPNVRDDNHWTPLHDAADYGNYEAVKLLIEYGANVDAQDMWNVTSLNLAAQHGYNRVTELLIDAGSNLALRDSYGMTPFTVALSNTKWSKQGNWIEVERLLRAAGAPE